MIPKSLHTVSVLVAVARQCRPINMPGYTLAENAAAAVDAAAELLGYAGAPDVYGLKATAARKLEREKAAR